MNTPWTDFLTQAGARLENSEIRFDTPEAEARAADMGTVVVPLTHLGLIRSSGEDAPTLLHNLFSNDIKKLAADGAQWSSFNTPKGRMLASLLLWPEASGHLVVASADIQPMLLKKLSMYVLRSKAKLTDASQDTVLIGVSGSDAQAILNRAGFSTPAADLHQARAGETACVQLNEVSYVLALPVNHATAAFEALTTAGAVKAGTAAWQLSMIRAGLPLVTAATQEEFVAQMLNFDLIGGVSFNKGCYPGQEIVARTQYLGKLKKRMYRVRIDGEQPLQPGTDLFTPDFGTQSAGKIVNSVKSPDGGYEALAVMQTSSAESGDVHAGAPDGPALVFLDLPYTQA